jgi:DNA-binding helix-hairpin-helix protein with protein kinase domain
MPERPATMSGQRLSLQGRRLRMVRASTVVSVGKRLGEGAQGVVHEATMGGVPCVVKWYRSVPSADLRRAIAALAERERPHPAFIWPIDLVVSDEMPGFGYVMPLLEPGFGSFAQLLARPEQPPFRVIITIGRQLVSAFEALHASGLCYRDINFGNLLVDPARPQVAIIDNDNVGLDSSDVFVWGTLRFMAPEVVRREAPPSSVTDLYSLAVLLFYLFMHGHPLEGMRTDATYSWATSDHQSESDLAIRHFGLEPVFVFDPKDHSNRPRPGDPMLTWWPIYPRFFRALFEQAFTAGLSPGLGRVTEGLWRRALVRLGDCISVCTCKASVFYDPDHAGLRCWKCGQIPPRPPLLQLPGCTVALSTGAAITSHHLSRDRDHDTIIAVVEEHPTRPAALVLRNVGKSAWMMTPDGETARTVEPARRLRVRAMLIDFGSVQGRILSETIGPRVAGLLAGRQHVPPPGD